MSLVIPSRNRAGSLQRTLAALNLDAMRRLGVDLVLVDSASEDDTTAVMVAFVKAAGIESQVLRAHRPGASLARNVGGRAAKGEVLIFTDDDCYLDAAYFDVIAETFDPAVHQYGGGDTRLYDPDDARGGITELGFDGPQTLKPGLLLPGGTIQSANMVITKAVFEKLGGFDERLGAGTPFPCEDIELCTRASRAGYAGVLMPRAKVLHHHGRKPFSAAAIETKRGYDRGRGAYIATLLAAGEANAWNLWRRTFEAPTEGRMDRQALRVLRDELRGAADYLDMLIGPGF
jgi:GT2 family glycosyltransferase